MAPAITVESLHKSYGSRRALRGISFRVDPGEVVGYIGPNGAGKSTTMRILLGLLRPTTGRAEVFGQDVRAAGPALRRRIGYLPGELHLDDRASVASVLSYLARLNGRPGSWREPAERLDLDPTRTVRQLSKGNKQKLGLVQALTGRPELLVLDEPTSGLDPLVQQEFRALLAEAREAGTAVLLSSHVMSEVEQVADRVVVLRAGEIAVQSSMAELLSARDTLVTVRLAASPPEHAFRHVVGVVAAAIEGPVVRLRVNGSPDSVVKALSDYEVIELSARRRDLEEVVVDLYEEAER